MSELEQLKKLKLHRIVKINGVWIQKVIGGFNYIYPEFNVGVFVPVNTLKNER